LALFDDSLFMAWTEISETGINQPVQTLRLVKLELKNIVTENL